VSDSRPFWRARLLPAFLGLLAVNLLVLAAWTGPRYWRQRGASARAEAARVEVERQRAATAARRDRAAAIRANGVDLDRFYERLAGTEKADLLPTMEAIEQLARAPGLRPGARSYRREDVGDARLERVAVTLPLEGTYSQLVAFLREVERSPRFLTVDRVALRGDNEGGATLQVELSTYLRRTEASKEGSGGRS
jgi:Tfp pilus assembly protein PilO